MENEIKETIKRYEEKLNKIQETSELAKKQIELDINEKIRLDTIKKNLDDIDYEIRILKYLIFIFVLAGLSGFATLGIVSIFIEVKIITVLICGGLVFGLLGIPSIIMGTKIDSRRNKKQKIIDENNIKEDELDSIIKNLNENIFKNERLINNNNYLKYFNIDSKIRVLNELLLEINNSNENNDKTQELKFDETNVDSLTDLNEELELAAAVIRSLTRK